MLVGDGMLIFTRLAERQQILRQAGAAQGPLDDSMLEVEQVRIQTSSLESSRNVADCFLLQKGIVVHRFAFVVDGSVIIGL